MILDKLYKFFTSLRLAVTLLGLGVVLVFLGTLAQEPLGLYAAQARFFKSFFVDAASFFAAWHKLVDMILQGFGHPLPPLNADRLLTAPRIPVFPGGYLIGGLLLINLFCAHLKYYQPGRKKYGIVIIHLGVVLLLVGQFLTDFLSVESTMHIRTHGTKNYSEAGAFELAVVDTTDADSDKVVAIPGSRLRRRDDISHPELPFTVRMKTFFGNSDVTNKPASGYEEVKATAGFGQGAWWRELPFETSMKKRDIPSALVELVAPQGSLGTYLASGLWSPQTLQHNGRTYEMQLRPERIYKPFSLHLVEFRHDVYMGTTIPKNYSSRVQLQRPDTGEDREVLISMNKPLRYLGETYYQSSFDPDDQGTYLQVVRNPSSLTPYCGCWLVALGLLVQFLTHFLDYLKIGLNSRLAQPERTAKLDAALAGVRGWLLCFAAGLLLLSLAWPLVQFSHLATIAKSLAGAGGASLAMHAGLALSFWIYMGFVVRQFFARRKSAAGHMIILIVTWPIFFMALNTISDYAFGKRSLATGGYAGATAQGLISIFVFFMTATWMLYFMRSKRVAATFVR